MRVRQIGVALIAPALAIVLWAAAVLVPNISTQRDLDERLAASEQQIVDLTGALEESKSLTGRVEALEEQSRRLDRAVPPTADTVGVVRLLHDLAVLHGVAVSSVSPTSSNVEPGAGGAAASSLTVSLDGSYTGALGFIDGLLVADRLIRIDRVDLSADTATGSLFVELTVSTYASEASVLTEIQPSDDASQRAEATLETAPLQLEALETATLEVGS